MDLDVKIVKIYRLFNNAITINEPFFLAQIIVAITKITKPHRCCAIHYFINKWIILLMKQYIMVCNANL